MQDHPLAELLLRLTEEKFDKIGLRERELPQYVAGILMDFTHVDRLHQIRDARGQAIEDVGEMLLEGDVRHRARSFERERSVRKHIGDFTLFFTGMFPEHIKARRNWWRLDRFLDWIETGKESYRIVSEFETEKNSEDAPLYRCLADHFDFMVVGLNFVRADLAKMKNDRYEISRNIIEQ